jgi:hypothetical protein
MTCCRMFAYIGTDRERLACAVHRLRDEVVAAPGAGYGVAHYTDDALLLNRRPGVEVGGHPFDEFLGGVKSRVLLVHTFPVELGQEALARDLHPFKFRSWAFACTGELGLEGEAEAAMREGLLKDLPDFIRRDVKGNTGDEALFHHFLWRLHEEGQLSAHTRDHGLVVRVLREVLDFAGGLIPGRDGAALKVNVLTTDGQNLYLLRRGALVAEQLREGLAECPLCFGPEGDTDSFSLRESHQRFRALFIAADLDEVPEGWRLVEEDGALVVDAQMEILAL